MIESGTDEETDEQIKQKITDESDVEETQVSLNMILRYDPVVKETIITDWHGNQLEQRKQVIMYRCMIKNLSDWNEKTMHISYAINLTEDDIIIWKIKNGGSPQKSIGIVSSKDKVEKYRVYLEWVDEKGWKPVKMDVLTYA